MKNVPLLEFADRQANLNGRNSCHGCTIPWSHSPIKIPF